MLQESECLDPGSTRVHYSCSGRIVDIFKSLGCKVDLPTTAEREKAGMSLADAKINKRAVLKAPVTYPKPKSRGPVKR